MSAPTWELLRVYPIWRPRPLCKSGSVSPFTSIADEKKGINGIEILVAGLFWDGASALLRAVTPSCNISYLSAQENLSLSLCEPNLVENSVKISPPGFFVSLLLFCLISKAAKFPIQTLSFIIYNVSFLFSFSCFLLERYDFMVQPCHDAKISEPHSLGLLIDLSPNEIINAISFFIFIKGESVSASDRDPARRQVPRHGGPAALHVQRRGERLQRAAPVGPSHGPDAPGQGTSRRPIQTLPQQQTSKFLLLLLLLKIKRNCHLMVCCRIMMPLRHVTHIQIFPFYVSSHLGKFIRKNQ